MADKQRFRVISKPTAKGGKASIVFAVISAVLMLADIIISFAFEGKAGTFAGAIGLCGALISVYGFALGIRGLGEKKVDHRLAFIGTVASGMFTIFWLAIFFVGIK